MTALALEPPNSTEAERVSLASLMMADFAVFSEMRAILTREMFFILGNRLIFDAICHLADAGSPREPTSVREELKRRGALEEAGGQYELGIILTSAIGYSQGKHYAEVVRDKAIRRGMIKAGHWLVEKAVGPSEAEETASDILNNGIGKLAKLASIGAHTEYQTIGDVVMEAYEQAEKGGAELVKTGFPSLDQIVGGIAIGEMCVIAARPSMGKSCLTKQMAEQIAANGNPVGLISLEESNIKIGRNLLAAHAGVDNKRIRRGDISKEEWARMADAAGRLSQRPLYITQRARKMSDIKAVVATWKARHGVKLIIIDYIQRIRGVQGKDRYEVTSNISLEVSELFKENEVAGIAVAQLNRGVEHREEKRPNMADLRDSGQIEQDADAIVFLHREDYYHIDDSSWVPTNEAELIIAKWRDSSRGEVVTLKSNLKYQRFEDYGGHAEPNI